MNKILDYAIADLKREAATAGDWKMVAICDRALGAGRYEVGSGYLGRMSDEEASAGRNLSIAQARAECVRVIDAAAAMVAE